MPNVSETARSTPAASSQAFRKRRADSGGSVSWSGSKGGRLRTELASATRRPSRAAACAAARRTALLIEARLKLPEMARISKRGGEAGSSISATQSSIFFPAGDTTYQAAPKSCRSWPLV